MKNDEFIKNLDKALTANSTVSTGRVHLVGLEKLREMIGSDWDRIKDRAHQIVRSVIESRLSPQDVFTAYGDMSYIIVFANLGKEEAQLKCTIIAQEICGRLIGNQSAEDFTDVSTLAAKDEGTLYFKKVPSIKNLVSDLEKKAKIDKREISFTPVDTPLANNIDFSKIRFIFRPLWYVRHEVVTTFICIPVRAVGDGSYVYGYNALPDPTNPMAIARMDSHILGCAAREFDKIAEKGKSALLSVPVHYETLAESSRRKVYVDLCSKLLSRHRDRMVFELVELPDGIPQTRILDLVSAVSFLARAVTANFSLNHKNFSDYRSAGLHAVGVDIYSEERSEKEIMRDMDNFAGAASRNNLKTYIHGVRTTSLKTAAIASGFDYIDGYALTSVIDSPGGAYPLGLKDSYLPLLEWDEARGKLAARANH